MFKLLFSAGAIALLTAVAAPAYATTTTIDFTSLPFYTDVATYFPGVTISLSGGPGYGDPVTGSFGEPAVGNSPSGNYPTSEILNFAFSGAVKDVSFTFDNYGESFSGRGASFYTAYNAASGVVSTGFIGNISPGGYGGLVTVGGSGIRDLALNNGTGGGSSWEFGVYSLTYTSGVPEASTWVMMLAGFAGLGFVGYRRNKVVANFGA